MTVSSYLRSELQIVFSGTGESQEYTKATASEGENKIDKLQVYLFASATGQAGSYYYMETWNEGTTFDSEDKDASGNPKTNFKKQVAGTMLPFHAVFAVPSFW